MNRIFKVIWSRTKGCYVVVAETARNMSKRSTMTSVFAKMSGPVIAAALCMSVISPMIVQGSTIVQGAGARAKDGTVAMGDSSTALADNSVALGTGATVSSGKVQGVAIGRTATVSADNGVAIGNLTKSFSKNGFALGNNSRAGYNDADQLVGKDNDQHSVQMRAPGEDPPWLLVMMLKLVVAVPYRWGMGHNRELTGQ